MISMKKACRITALLLTVCVALPLLSPAQAQASIPARRTLRIGLSYGSTALPYANLENEDGTGYDFGYYDANNNFTSITSTAEKKISVLIDQNMQYSASGGGSGSYTISSSPSGIYIGFAHRVIGSYNSYNTALTAANAYAGGFVRYNAGSSNPFMALYGNYTSSASAGSGANTGTATTIVVTASGSNRILFEFDNTANRSLIFGIRPKGAVTWHKGYKYNGGFRFERHSASSNALTVVNIIGLEDYIKGVVPYEMSASWPLEALKAQAICARTYALSQLDKHNNSYSFDLCSEADCQVYRGRNSANSISDSAVTSTAGKVVTHNGNLIQTLYSSSHGGGSENNENIWAGTPLPYLRGVLDDYEDAIASTIGSSYEWTLSISQSDLTQRVRNAGYPQASTIATLQVSLYSPTGNVVSVIAKDTNGISYTFSRRAGLQALFGATPLRSQRFNIGSVVWSLEKAIYANSSSTTFQSVNGAYYVISGSGAATTISPSASTPLKAIDGSGNVVNVEVGIASLITAGAATGPSNGYFILKGKGWGHSVGMSQWGARSQAQIYGRTAEQIIRHYYTGVTITQA